MSEVRNARCIFDAAACWILECDDAGSRRSGIPVHADNSDLEAIRRLARLAV